MMSAVCAGGHSFAAWERALYDGFEAGDFSPAGGLYYKRNPEQKAGTVEFQSEITYRGKGALRLSVAPGLAEIAENGSERAEIWERPELWVPYDKGVWYGFAVKFAPPIPQDEHRYLIAQWKREIAGTLGNFSPFLALRLNRGKLFATVETNLLAAQRGEPKRQAAQIDDGETAVWLRPETNQTRALVATDTSWRHEDGRLFSARTREIAVTNRGNALPTPSSGWIDFAIYAKPGPDGTGHIEIFANGKWIVTVRGRIGHAEPGLGHHQYFKFGPYRAAHRDLWTLYYDEFRRSPNCADIPSLTPSALRR